MAGRGHIEPEIFDEILERLILGEGLRPICRESRMPAESTFYAFIARDKEAAERYAQAREWQAHGFVDEIKEIADAPKTGFKVKRMVKSDEEIEDGGDVIEVTEGDMLEHRRLQIDSRKWLAAKLAPKKYGARSEHHITGELTVDTLAERLARAKAKAGDADGA